MICCCASTEAYMYTAGGASGVSFPTGVVTAYKSAMTSGTTSAVSSANLSGTRVAHSGFANPGTAGYSTGGATSLSAASELSSTDKTTFSNDTTSASGTATLSQTRQQACAFPERTSKAYVIAGGIHMAGVLTAQQTADVFTYSSDTFAATTSAKATTAVKWPAGQFGNTTKGYFAGGYITTFSTAVVTGYKTTFSGDSTAATASVNLSVARTNLAAGSDGSAKGYWCGGQNGSPVTTCDTITVSTDTTAVISATLSRNETGFGSDGTNLVIMSGSTTDGSGTKITFATDTFSTFGTGSAGNITTAVQAPASFSTVAL